MNGLVEACIIKALFMRLCERSAIALIWLSFGGSARSGETGLLFMNDQVVSPEYPDRFVQFQQQRQQSAIIGINCSYDPSGVKQM